MMALSERQHSIATQSPERPRVDFDLHNNQLTPAPNTDRVRAIVRSYFNIHLKNHGYHSKADQLVNIRGLNNKIHRSMEKVLQRLENDTAEQFTDILGTLFVTNVNRQEAISKYDTVAMSMFSDTVNWGRVLTFLRFSAEFAVRCILTPHCKISLLEVLEWTEEVLAAKFPLLIEAEPEIGRMLTSNEEWNIDMSAIAFTTGLAVAMVTVGFFALKRILT